MHVVVALDPVKYLSHSCGLEVHHAQSIVARNALHFEVHLALQFVAKNMIGSQMTAA